MLHQIKRLPCLAPETHRNEREIRRHVSVGLSCYCLSCQSSSLTLAIIWTQKACISAQH